jgi:hypothetical protein
VRFISKAATFPNDFRGEILMYAYEIESLRKHTIFILLKHSEKRCAGKKQGHTLLALD